MIITHLPNLDSEYRVTPNGFEEYTGLEGYRGITVRKKVVLRVDLLDCFREVFGSAALDTPSKRHLVYLLVSGSITDTDKLSNIFTTFYCAYPDFKYYVGELFYFAENDKYSFYQRLMLSFRTRFREAESKFSTQLCRNIGAKVLYTSHGYLYFSIVDAKQDYQFCRDYRMEVLSNAKCWSGKV